MPDNNAQVLARLQTAYPGAQIETVKPTPMKSVFEVNLGGRVMYSDASGRYVLFGRMHDMQEEKSSAISQEYEQTELPVPTSAQGVRDLFRSADRNSIKYVKGTGATSLYLFTDPKCPYCRQLEAELDKLDNVTVYKFPYPVLSNESRNISMKVWCSQNQAAEWTKAMRGAAIQGPAACPNPLDANIRMARELGLKGTPALLNSQGKLLVGYRSAESVAQLFGLPGARK